MSCKEKALEQIEKRGYELNGANTLDAALWFLSRERDRHYNDIYAIDRDIEALLKLGAKLPTTATDMFFAIPGVKY